MATTTKTRHILNIITSYLDDDATLSIVKVWDEKNFKPTVPTVAKVYVWSLIDQYGAFGGETSDYSETRIMQVGIYCEFFKGANDIASAGTLTDTYAEYSERIEKRLDAINEYIRSNGSITDTTTVGSYTISIVRVTQTSRTGLVDNGDRTSAGFVVTLNVSYLQS